MLRNELIGTMLPDFIR